MIILGINDNHDASAAVIAGGEVRSAVSQERLDRHKNSRAFPWEAIEEALRLAGVRREEVDRIVFGSVFTPVSFLRERGSLHQQVTSSTSQFSPLLNAYIAYQVGVRESGLWAWEMGRSRRILAERMKARGFEHAELNLLDHHTAHAYSAYRSQPHSRSLVFTLDAMGDGNSTTVSLADSGDLKQLFRQSGFAALNTYYSRITEYLGFRANRHEGKLTGLAAYAPPPAELLEHFRQQLHFKGPGFSLTNYMLPQHKKDRFHSFLENYDRAQISAALQRNLEHAVCDYVRHWVQETGVGHVALAGGVCANVKLNQRILELPEVESLFVYPNMGDGGLAVGAALFYSDVGPEMIQDVYLGSDIGEPEARAALEGSGLTFSRPEDLAGAVAEALADSKVLARASGRMEWGPRALGNRSILYRPDDPSVNKWLNEKLCRTEFMPFAPSTLWEARERCYVNFEGAADAARFMTVCFDCTPWMSENAGGVVHIDGTARPQLVRQQDNPGYHAIIKAFEARTGNPSVINTSFNMHEEPIVRTAEEAVTAFKQSRLDYLVLGPYLVEGLGLGEVRGG